MQKNLNIKNIGLFNVDLVPTITTFCYHIFVHITPKELYTSGVAKGNCIQFWDSRSANYQNLESRILGLAAAIATDFLCTLDFSCLDSGHTVNFLAFTALNEQRTIEGDILFFGIRHRSIFFVDISHGLPAVVTQENMMRRFHLNEKCS